MRSVGLKPINLSVPTHYSTTNSTLLDMFFINDTSKILLYDQLSAPQFSRHDLIFLCYDFMKTATVESVIYRDFKNTDYQKLYDDYDKIDWSPIYFIPSTDDQVEFLQQNVVMLYNQHVKLKKKPLKRLNRPWFNDDVKNAIIDRDNAYEKWKKYKIDFLHRVYKEKRRRAVQVIKKAKKQFYSDRFSRCSNNRQK